MMAIQTKNLTEIIRNSKKQQYSFGIKEHQNHNLTGRRQKSGKIQSIKKKKSRTQKFSI
jgi:hypothetical protein